MNQDELRQRLTGPIASLRVPFQRDGEIDFRGLANSIEFDIAANTSTILLTYGDSLYSILTDDEVAAVTKAAIDCTRGRAIVVAADRMWWTGKAVSFAKFAREAGADVLMALPPDWAQSGTAETFSDHYAAVAQHIPVMIVTAAFLARPADFTLQTMRLTLQKSSGVVAIKDDLCGAVGRKLSLLVRDQWAFISGGQKQNHLDVWPYGCEAYLSAFTTFKPQIAQIYWNAIQAGDTKSAAGVIRDYEMPFFDFITKVPGGFDAAIHGILELSGIAERWRRPPYNSLTDAEMENLSVFLNSLYSQ
jgi:5-dehydro-4-deoxyglucarate dehydratase